MRIYEIIFSVFHIVFCLYVRTAIIETYDLTLNPLLA